MRRSAAAVAVALLAAVGGSASAGTGLVSIGAGLRGPSGVHATVYATGLRNVSAIAVDSRGRLWATTSAASDHSHDGLYLVLHRGAKPVLVAHVAEPLGLVWDGSTLFVAARGRVYAFAHLAGHRFGKRSVILDGPDPKAANDTILVLPNGRLVMSVSATCDHCRQSSRYSAAIVTFDRDGSDLRVYASGVRDGYGLALVPGTSTLLVSINQRDDLGARTPGDWLAVVRQRQNWGFPSCWGQGGTACRDVPSPLAVLDRHAGAGAVAIFDDSAIVTEWATGKVMQVPLTGATATVYLTGFRNPLAATVASGRLLIGDWTTGRIYSIAGVDR